MGDPIKPTTPIPGFLEQILEQHLSWHPVVTSSPSVSSSPDSDWTSSNRSQGTHSSSSVSNQKAWRDSWASRSAQSPFHSSRLRYQHPLRSLVVICALDAAHQIRELPPGWSALPIATIPPMSHFDAPTGFHELRRRYLSSISNRFSAKNQTECHSTFVVESLHLSAMSPSWIDDSLILLRHHFGLGQPVICALHFGTICENCPILASCYQWSSRSTRWSHHTDPFRSRGIGCAIQSWFSCRAFCPRYPECPPEVTLVPPLLFWIAHLTRSSFSWGVCFACTSWSTVLSIAALAACSNHLAFPWRDQWPGDGIDPEWKV